VSGALLAGAAAILGLSVLPRLFPVTLPNLAEPSLIYARPHRITVGQNVVTSGLIERLERIGYRDTDGTLGPGGFRRDRRELTIHRRAFHTPAAAGDARAVTLSLDATGRIQAMADTKGGAPAASLLLEPEVIGELHTPLREFRDTVPLLAMPEPLVRAVLTLEDRRFYRHGGIDPRRIVGAMVANLRGGGLSQGGSTITQQLVKNVYLDSRRTLERKLREAWLALRVEAGQDKDKILETYLNTIYLGQRGSVSIHGVQAAARHYFGKPVGDLSLGESALLAGMVRGPGLYSPYRNVARATDRRDFVLDVLYEQQAITAEQRDAAKAEVMTVLDRPPQPLSAPYYAEWVIRQLRAELPDADLQRSGLAVVTGLDASLQALATSAVVRGLAKLEASEPSLVRPDQPLQAALVAIDPHSGDVLAMVGGREQLRGQFDRATTAKRQPGSVFKPVVALAALAPSAAKGGRTYTLASVLDDSPLRVETRAGVWEPSNYDGEFHGEVTLRRAVERSLNVPLARIALDIGPERIVETARRLGVTSPLIAVPSIALGSFEMTPLEVASVYTVFANGGERHAPRTYTRVLAADGTVITSRSVERERVFPAAEIALVTSILQGAVERGTAAAVRREFSGPLAAKTGTTNDFRDAWFVAYTPDLVAAVWIGYDDGAPLGLPSSRAALPMGLAFVRAALGPGGGRGFPQPDGVEYVDIEAETGLRAGFGCPGDPEIFLPGTAPLDRCAPRFVRSEPPREPRATAQRNPTRDPASRRTPPGDRRTWAGAIGDFFGSIFGR
jgi:penicillin-binding protein 1B